MKILQIELEIDPDKELKFMYNEEWKHVFKTLRELFPEIKTIGIRYTSREEF